MSGSPVLYSFRRCPYAMRARLAIAASGQRCELREVVLRDKPQALVQASPKATVPVLVLGDGTVLEESLDIMLWVLRLRDPQGWLIPDHGSLDAMLALVQECDECFKPKLDRYKYPQRFAGERGALAGDSGGSGRAGGGRAGGALASNGSALASNGSGPDSNLNDLASGGEGSASGGRDDAGLAVWAAWHRDTAAGWLEELEARLGQSAHLFGERASLADMAIAPFVRQYAHVDRAWFDARPWPALRAWLYGWMESELFVRVMAKYRPWTPGEPGEPFP